MSQLHREGRVVRLVSDSILEVDRTIAGHSEGLGGAVEEREERGEGEKGEMQESQEGSILENRPCVVLPTFC